MRSNPINLYEAREVLRKKLIQSGDETPAATSLVLLSHVLQQPKSWLLAHSEYELKPEEIDTLHRRLEKYLRGFPLPYILGHWDFYGRTFKVNPDVLIPRPETELLVEQAINHAQGWTKPLIVDVGTGSGIIAITLAAELPSAKVIGLDLSWNALLVAQSNAKQLDQSQIYFVQSDLLVPLKTKFDLICANLPYIPSSRLAGLAVSKWEPQLALDGGESGLRVINILLKQAQTRLAKPGMILLEIDSNLGEAALIAARDAFPHASHLLIKDLTDRHRLIEIRQE